MLAALATTVPMAPIAVSIDSWESEVGDQVFINTKVNEGFLVHPDGEYVRFPLATGQRRWVSYIGRYYNAATPNWDWEIKSTHIKGDRVTYGPTGRFLRMYKDGDDRTAYGIHGHRDAANVLAGDKRFYSMGCVIVNEDILDIIEYTYQLNEGSLKVRTRFGDPFQSLL
ncbi:MAG: L,D-transpeptidase [bacterium]|nr:L,D-transpeptidase [bacterium]